MYVRVWGYHVDDERAAAFRAAYGSQGAWAQLFRNGPGYAGTDLYSSTDEATRFITIDRERPDTSLLARPLSIVIGS